MGIEEGIDWAKKVFLVSDKQRFENYCKSNKIIIDPFNLQADFSESSGVESYGYDEKTPTAYFMHIFCDGLEIDAHRDKQDSHRDEPGGGIRLKPFSFGHFTPGYAPYIRVYLSGQVEKAFQEWTQRKDFHTKLKILYNEGQKIKEGVIQALEYPCNEHNYRMKDLVEV